MNAPILEGEIGLDITLSSFKGVESVLINSPGGSLFAGLAQYDYIKGSGVEVGCIGVCASAATLPLLASEKRWGTPNSRYLIHNPWNMAIGNADDMQRTADDLRLEQNRALDLYMTSLIGTREEIAALMDAEKILTADEAMAIGLIKEIRTLNQKDEPKPDGSDIKNLFTQFKMFYDMDKTDVKKELSGIRAMLDSLMKFISPKMLVVQDVNGVEIDFGTSATSEEEIKVGVTATIDGKPAQGDIVTKTGETWFFDGGELKEIKPSDGDDEMAALVAENAELKAQIQNLETEKTGIQNKMDGMATELKAVNTRFEAFSKAFTGEKPKVNVPPVQDQNQNQPKFSFKKR